MENAFVILGQFSKKARRAGWDKEKIAKVLKDATSGDYGHLNGVIYRALVEIEEKGVDK